MRALDELERVSLLLVVLGLATVYVASVVYEPPAVSLSALDESFIGDTVRVEGNVTSIRQMEAAQFLTLKANNRRISAVYFGNRDLGAIPYRVHRVEGEVDVYRGELELIIRDIEPITD